jgi:hypothetical protein
MKRIAATAAEVHVDVTTGPLLQLGGKGHPVATRVAYGRLVELNPGRHTAQLAENGAMHVTLARFSPDALYFLVYVAASNAF